MKLHQPKEQKPASETSLKKQPSQIMMGVIVAVLLLFSFSVGVLISQMGLLGKWRLQIEPVVHSAVDTMDKNVTDELRLYQDNGLPTLSIDLKFKYYRQMLEKRDEALRIGILQTTDEDFVPVTISLDNGPKMDAKMRLKGDWTDHLEGDKWSFRIHLKNDSQIFGFRQFSVQTPETRNFLYEWAFHQNLIEEDVLTTRYHFVNVMLNGKLLGIYGIEESFTGELIESQERRQGVIIRFDEDNLWDKWAYFYANGTKFIGHGWSYTTEKTADISSFQSGKIENDPTLTAEAETARSLLYSYEAGMLPASQVFDVRLMGRFFALSDLWAACHGTNWHNLRFYYNPVTARLEPVVFDAIPFTECKQDATRNFIFDAGNRIFNDDEIKRAYVEELYRITRPGYIDALKQKNDAQAQSLTQSLQIEYDQEDLNIDWQQLVERQAFLNLWFTPPNPVKGAYSIRGINPGDARPVILNVELTNISPLPVDVIRFEIDGKPIQTSLETPSLSSYKGSDDVPTYAMYSIPLSDAGAEINADNLPQLDAVVQLGGLSQEIKVKLDGVMTPAEISLGPIPESGGTEELLNTYPFISASPNGDQLLVSPGVWDISGDLLIPENVTLQIAPGSVLRFEPGAVLLARGAINMLGTVSNPILLTAQDDQNGWGGIVVLNAGKESRWKYARVESTHGIERQGWILTGGITFFASDIYLDHAIIGNNQTEDAINVIHGKFTFVDSVFENTFADAFDSDFSNGEIKDCGFHNVQGDAVDVSGTQAKLSNLELGNIGDKGLSIGENSHVQAENLSMDTVGIGVASKDLSSIIIIDSQIRNASFAGLAAYIKKPVYGPATITAQNVEIIDSAQLYVAQVGSVIQLNGETVMQQDLDVDRLYAEGILGN